MKMSLFIFARFSKFVGFISNYLVEKTKQKKPVENLLKGEAL